MGFMWPYGEFVGVCRSRESVTQQGLEYKEKTKKKMVPSYIQA